MPSSTTRSLSALGAAALLATAVAVPAFAAGPVSVTLNGNPLNLNPAPTERAGRVFVPLRGVFENLGASVVYQGGVINATGRGHNVSLKVGSQQAMVDGQQQSLDVAPFIIGASTYVPLRFVSQALGATVNYDGANRVVALSTNGSVQAQNPAPQQTSAPSGQTNVLRLGRVSPPRDQAVEAQNPTIAAEFTNGTADPNTVRVSLDGLDVTDRSTRSPQGIVYAPPSPLITGRHTVHVTGKDSNGISFTRQWSFVSGTKVIPNDIMGLNLQEGQQVNVPFTVSGHTLPGAHVIVTAGVLQQQGSLGGLLGAILGNGQGGTGGATARNEIDADAQGNFSTQVTLNAPSGAQVGVKVDSTDRSTGAAAKTVTRTVVVR
jgi:hypothetical protein